MKGKREKEIADIRVSGLIFHPDGVEEMILEPVRPAKGFGRWIYYKYCGEHVKPMLSGINQIVCSECGAGLTAGFFRVENLKRWLAGDRSALEDDLKEAQSLKAEFKSWKAEKNR